MGNPNGWSLGGALGGAALSGAFGLIGSAMQHKYEKENMALQNEYAMQAEERANAFNAPSAVRARMESAGMNPAAFMGQTSGAGIQGGMSSAPTPSTSASVGSIDTSGISNIGSVMAQQESNRIANERMIAENELTKQKAISEKYTNQILLPLEASLKSVLTSKERSEAEIAAIEASFRSQLLTLKTALEEKNIERVEASIAQAMSSIEKDKAYISLSEEEKKKVKQEVKESQARTYREWVEGQKSAIFAQLEMQNLQLDNALKSAQKGHTDALKKQVIKEAELIGAKIGYTEQQTKALKNKIAQEWTKIGIDLAHRTSTEVREWMYGWIPFRKSQYDFTQQVDADRYGAMANW